MEPKKIFLYPPGPYLSQYATVFAAYRTASDRWIIVASADDDEPCRAAVAYPVVAVSFPAHVLPPPASAHFMRGLADADGC
jgi:hypothetical protein